MACFCGNDLGEYWSANCHDEEPIDRRLQEPVRMAIALLTPGFIRKLQLGYCALRFPAFFIGIVSGWRKKPFSPVETRMETAMRERSTLQQSSQLAVRLIVALSVCICCSVSSFAPALPRDRRETLRLLAAAAPSAQDSLWKELKHRFQGDFDNYEQVVEDRIQGLLPREGGGHENIHCSLIPVADDARLAAFYFDGTPKAIFRFRYYKLVPASQENSTGSAVDTVLYTLNPELEMKLRQCADRPLEWPEIFSSFDSTDRVRLLPRCDVRWSWDMDPVLHAYAAENKDANGDGIHAVMVHGQALVDSQMIPGQKILIKDQLSLWNDALWIHDRGFNPDTGDFIYGNQRDIPYRLQRVAEFDDDGTRSIVQTKLAWTLGSEYRSPMEYQSRLDAMGGPSIPERRPKASEK